VNMQCSNIEGSYVCDCLDTFYLESDGSCVCAEGFTAVSEQCLDVDECLEKPCGETEVRCWALYLHCQQCFLRRDIFYHVHSL